MLTSTHGHGPTEVYNLEKKVKFSGSTAGFVDYEDLQDNTIVVNCGALNEVLRNPYQKVPEGMKLPGVDLASRNIYELWLNWGDYGKPPVSRDIWKKIYSEAKRMKVKNLIFCCTGGHGRTGTALAAMLICCAKQTAKEAADFVRENYCEDAIESLSQEEYLCNLAQFVHGGELEKPSSFWKKPPPPLPKVAASTYTAPNVVASNSQVTGVCKYEGCNNQLTKEDGGYDSCYLCWNKYERGGSVPEQKITDLDEFWQDDEMGGLDARTI